MSSAAGISPYADIDAMRRQSMANIASVATPGAPQHRHVDVRQHDAVWPTRKAQARTAAQRGAARRSVNTDIGAASISHASEIRLSC